MTELLPPHRLRPGALAVEGPLAGWIAAHERVLAAQCAAYPVLAAFVAAWRLHAGAPGGGVPALFATTRLAIELQAFDTRRQLYEAPRLLPVGSTVRVVAASRLGDLCVTASLHRDRSSEARVAADRLLDFRAEA